VSVTTVSRFSMQFVICIALLLGAPTENVGVAVHTVALLTRDPHCDPIVTP